jgi:hypothetical protein
MPNSVKPWRVILKAMMIFCVLNFAFILLYHWLSDHQVYNSIFPGRLRFPWAQVKWEQAVHSLSLYDDMDAMFSSHIISAGEKPAGEFRIIFLGDSSFWGDGISVGDTLPEQINRLDLRNCQNQKIVAYNLALPSLYVMKDLLFLNSAMKYKPDMIVWGVTLRSLSYSNQNDALFLPSQSDEALYLINHYRLNIPTASLKPGTFWDQTLLADRSNLKKLFILQADGLPWAATGVDSRITTTLQTQVGNDIETKSVYVLHGSTLTADGLMFDVLHAAVDLARPAPILIVNEPIFIATGKNSREYYDAYYSRLLYDQYRKILSDWVQANHQPYLDAWNSIPDNEFTDTPFHLSGNGEKQLASVLIPTLLRMSCPGGQ